MTKLSSTSIALSAAMMLGAGGFAHAQGVAPSTEVPRTAGQIPARDQPAGDGIAANGRCGGVSFGTGASRCGDASGGPADGIDSRN